MRTPTKTAHFRNDVMACVSVMLHHKSSVVLRTGHPGSLAYNVNVVALNGSQIIADGVCCLTNLYLSCNCVK